MPYFRLNPECYLVIGKAKSAIYDLITGNIIALNEKNTKELVNAENNRKILRDEFLVKLKKMNVGRFYEEPVYIEKYRTWSIWERFSLWPNPLPLRVAQIQITNKCNLNCPSCKDISWKGRWCPDCLKLDGDIDDLSVNTWIDVIDQLADLKCQNLIITGGEAALYPNLYEIIERAKDRKLLVFIVTNGLNIPNYLKGENVIVNVSPFTVQKLFSDRIKKDLKSLRYPYLNCVGLKKKEIFELSRIVKWRNVSSRPLHHVPVNKGMFPKTSTANFDLAMHYDPCLFGRLSITSSGDIIPCFMVKKSLGNVKKIKIYQCMEKLIRHYWEANKDKIEECKKCEFRYACPACLPAIESGNPCDYFEGAKENDNRDKGTYQKI